MDKSDVIAATQHARDVCNHQAIELLGLCNLFVASTRRARREGDRASAFPFLTFERDESRSPEFCLISGDLEIAQTSLRATIETLEDLLDALKPVREAADLLCRERRRKARG